MGKLYLVWLEAQKVFGCADCGTHLSSLDRRESVRFQGHHGAAWLFTEVVNVIEGPLQDRSMTTGMHTVRDIYCTKCGQLLGWRYVKAAEEDQKYKERKFILERALVQEIPNA
ncbi:hypothetical protein SmJEL517_g03688 [Synchytrium microbalum]|uniref:Protein yippee-like n=1 Tax=Synchytrium microbalum TaxID=1806994 RepID=A0A507C5N8_9FUNG|nr:uncharacterized protein SmJEL517_g03688 [Synchytrium microbalum]TPX33404.1 hypothetical protein SmJEL517_g03688 [Synchytrium microbalum]